VASGVLALAGCGGKGGRRAIPTPTTARPAGPPGALPAARTAEQGLLRAYAATLRRHPQLQPLLAVPLDHHRAHAAALRSSVNTTGGDDAVPADARSAMNSLIAMEQATSDQRVTQAVVDAGHGSLLAALAAAEAVHADLLTSALPQVAAPATSTSATKPSASRTTSPPPPTASSHPPTSPRTTPPSPSHARTSAPPTSPPAASTTPATSTPTGTPG
jgi:hypothetical protein